MVYWIAVLMSENKDFLVEKKIKTEQDVKHNESRKQVVKKTTEYALRIYDEMMAKKKKQKNKLKNNQQEKLNKIKKNILATKIQNCFRQHKERKQLNDEIKKNMLLMEDFGLLVGSKQTGIAVSFTEDKMKKCNEFLQSFQKEKEKNIRILGEEQYNKKCKEIKELYSQMYKYAEKNKDVDNISNQSTRPSTALSSISGVSNNSSISSVSNTPNVKKDTQQIKL